MEAAKSIEFECNKSFDDMNSIEVSQFNSLLMTLFEESQVENCDDERLRTLIQSLEAEIAPILPHDHTSVMETSIDSYQEGFLSSDMEQIASSSMSNNDYDLYFADSEISSSCSNVDLIDWSIEHSVDMMMEEVSGSAGNADYSWSCSGAALEDGCSSLWQNTY